MFQQSLMLGVQLDDNQKCHRRRFSFDIFSIGFVITLFFAFMSICYGQLPQLNPGEVIVGKEVIDHGDDGTEIRYTIFKGDYNHSKAAEYAQEYFKYKGILDKDQQAMNAESSNLHANVELLASYSKLTEEERKEFLKSLGGALLGKILDGAATLNPWNVNNAINWLKDHGVDSDIAASLLRSISKVPDKRDKIDYFIKGYNAGKEGTDAEKELGSDDSNYNKTLYLVLGSLKVAQGNPELAPWITSAEVTESFVFLGVMGGWKNTLPFVTNDNQSGVVNRIVANTDFQLVSLTRLASSTKQNFDKCMAAKKAWQSAMGNYNATPIEPIANVK
jgi:hypothetical protein